MKIFYVRCNGDLRTTQAIESTDAANAAKQYAGERRIGNVIVPLRKENPTRIFTHNGQADYMAEQWSGNTESGFRLWIYS